MIKIKQATKQGWIECCDGCLADVSYPDSETRRGRVQEGGAICSTLTCRGVVRISELSDGYEIRSITPRECFVLQGMIMEDCDKAHAVGVSNSQLYKQAGNGLVSNCVTLLLEHLYKALYDSDYQCIDEKMRKTTPSTAIGEQLTFLTEDNKI